MSNVLLKRCSKCKEYTLQEACPRCGAKALPNRPAKYSPEDNYGAYRRKLKKLDAGKRAAETAEPTRVAGTAPGSAVSADSAAGSAAKKRA